ncbi:MerR family transcriptional regulator [Levilactobacillus parabrevis]|uniref:MerR family transcriptional regulator n=1 Tax=Levilactobacillus parabrevis TaxID=357278 RepID=UPI0021A8421E|nr:MerR family transcriptional regulator [Levilactobacillus parabrevis]MCT4486720.1 MerR family transcriptional regulator [Levilactobacillus parabrevis]MCT4489997.1 MerR family transcriptional regulator [Levilactobacillus parabrevis]
MAEFTDQIRQTFDFHRLVFRIGELSSMTGVSARQLRYWEKKELIVSREREDGQQARVYTFKTFIKVSMMKYFLDAGYTLAGAAKQAQAREENVKHIHRFVSTGMKGFAMIDSQMAINLGAFDDTQTLMALLPDDGPIHYKLLPNDEAQRLTDASRV